MSELSSSSHVDTGAANTPIPDWMLGGPASPPPAAEQRRPVLEKLLNGVARMVESAMAADASSENGGLLQRLDPRFKLIGLLALLLAAILVHHMVALLALLALALVLVFASRLGLGRFILRAWTFVPLFTLVIVLPAMTSWVTPGRALVHLWGDGAITATGLAVTARVILRVTDAVSFSVLLAMTTRWDELLAALRVVRVPRTFVFVLAVSYRYVFVLMRLVQGMVTARRSRTVGRLAPSADRRFVSAAVGTLFGHSQAMSEQVHTAMLARGFTGEVRSRAVWRVHARDYVWAVVVPAVVVAVVALELTVTPGF